jgi:hypothetical protein
LYYPERQVQTLVQGCLAAGFPADQVTAVTRALTEEYVDVKRSDARELLFAVRDVLSGVAARPEQVQFDFARSSVFEAMYNQDRPIWVDGREVRLQAVMEHAALHSTEFDAVLVSALNRDLVAYFGMLLGIRVSPEEVAVQDTIFREEHGIDSPEALQVWLSHNAMSQRDLGEYLTQEAMCSRMRRWMVSIRGFDRGARPILNELRRRGEFPGWAAAAAEEAVIFGAYRNQPEYELIEREHPAKLAATHAARTGVRIAGDVRLWAEQAGFEDVTAVEEALCRSAVYLDVKCRIHSHLEALNLLGDERAGEGRHLDP